MIALTAALWLVSAQAHTDETAVTVLAGRWTYDAAKSRVLDPDLHITQTANGTLMANGRTIAWAPIAPDTWRATKKKDEQVVETMTVTLSGSTLRTEKHGTLPDGSPYERIVTYRREGRGEGLIGDWRSTQVDTGATWDGFVISTGAHGVVTWRIPTDLQVITGPFDGSDLAIVGPNGPTGSTLAWRVTGPRSFAYVMKNGEQTAERGTITISSDLRLLTEETWSVDQPDRKSKLVYRRDP